MAGAAVTATAEPIRWRGLVWRLCELMQDDAGVKRKVAVRWSGDCIATSFKTDDTAATVLGLGLTVGDL